MLILRFIILCWVSFRIGLHASVCLKKNNKKKHISFLILSSAAPLYEILCFRPSWLPSLLWLLCSHAWANSACNGFSWLRLVFEYSWLRFYCEYVNYNKNILHFEMHFYLFERCHINEVWLMDWKTVLQLLMYVPCGDFVHLCCRRAISVH